MPIGALVMNSWTSEWQINISKTPAEDLLPTLLPLQWSVGVNPAELVQCRKVAEGMGVKGQENLKQNSSRAWGKIVICQYALGRNYNCWRAGHRGMYGFVITSISD